MSVKLILLVIYFLEILTALNPEILENFLGSGDLPNKDLDDKLVSIKENKGKSTDTFENIYQLINNLLKFITGTILILLIRAIRTLYKYQIKQSPHASTASSGIVGTNI